MGEMLWTLEGVHLPGEHVPRLDAVTLRIRPGTTAVMGCSGAGKTSLLNLLVGFEEPDGGVISRDLPTRGHSLPLYWVPQDGGLWPHLSVREHLEAARPEGGGEAGIAALLDSLDILYKADSYPAELSMGERSRLAVARALMARPAVLVMDEPLVHVDRAKAVRYWEVIRNHVRETGSSLVFATHVAQEVMREAERVICLKEGRVLYEGEVAALYWHPATVEQAECLGVVNWLGPEDGQLWLGKEPDGRSCYRPEHLAIRRSADGPLLVRSAHFMGPIGEVELLHEESGEVRRFYHHPCSDGLHVGDRVVMKVLVILLLILLVGCGRGDPSIPVKAMRTWQMPASGLTIPAPRAVAIGEGDEVFVLDTAGRVLVFDERGALKRQWRMPQVQAGTPEGICVLKGGRVAVPDTHYHRVILFDQSGRVVGQFGRYGTGPGEFIYPVAVVQDDQGDLYVCEYGSNDRVQKFTPDGEFLLAFGSFGTAPGEFQRPSGMVWHDRRLYVADAINNRIQLFSDTGQFLGVLGAAGRGLSLQFPYDIAMGRDGMLYVAEYGAGRVTKVRPDGQLLGRYGSTGRGEGQFITPWGLAIDSKMRLRIADTGNRRIVEVKL